MSDGYSTENCDRCYCTIVSSTHHTPHPFQISRRVDDPDTKTPEYEVETRQLCEACEEELLEWIDGSMTDRHDCVDLPAGLESAEALENMANTLEVAAETLRAELDSDA